MRVMPDQASSVPFRIMLVLEPHCDGRVPRETEMKSRRGYRRDRTVSETCRITHCGCVIRDCVDRGSDATIAPHIWGVNVTPDTGVINMPSVVVDALKAEEETNELGSDDVYMMTFRGPVPSGAVSAGTAEFTVVGPGSYWDDFDSGETHNRDVRLADFDTQSVYVANLIEQDNRRDIKGSVESAYRSTLNLIWALLLAQTAGQTGESRRAALASGISEALRGLNTIYMELPKGNDDWIGSPQRFRPNASSMIDVVFRGDGGRYRARIKVVP